MKRAIYFVSVAVVMAALAGCQTDCGQCNGRCCGRGGAGGAGGYGGPEAMAGSPMAAVAYPYYTVHGPRDFLDKNPESLGP